MALPQLLPILFLRQHDIDYQAVRRGVTIDQVDIDMVEPIRLGAAIVVTGIDIRMALRGYSYIEPWRLHTAVSQYAGSCAGRDQPRRWIAHGREDISHLFVLLPIVWWMFETKHIDGWRIQYDLQHRAIQTDVYRGCAMDMSTLLAHRLPVGRRHGRCQCQADD